MGFAKQGEHTFINRCISGNRIVDLYARIKADIINLKPDLMSILIGVNDVWHETGDNPNGVDADKFYKIYNMLIEEIKAARARRLKVNTWTVDDPARAEELASWGMTLSPQIFLNSKVHTILLKS